MISLPKKVWDIVSVHSMSVIYIKVSLDLYTDFKSHQKNMFLYQCLMEIVLLMKFACETLTCMLFNNSIALHICVSGEAAVI